MDNNNAQRMKEDLKGATTLNQVIQVANKYYDLDQKLGVMQKGVVNLGIEKLITTLNLKKR